MKNSVVSVIVPVFNTSKYLKKCIKSILEQSYKNLEILIIDDGSTDGSFEICEKLKKKDNRIKIFHKNNGGLSSARNVGLKKATGDFVCFIDSDDWVEKDYVLTLLETIGEDADVAICSFYEDNANVPEIDIQEENLSGAEIFQKMAEPLGYKFVVVWNKMYRASALENLLFVEGKIHEDQWLASDVFLRVNQVKTISNKLYHHVNHESGITFNKQILLHFDDIDALIARVVEFERTGAEQFVSFAERQLAGVVEFYLSHTFGAKAFSSSEIRKIKKKLTECFRVSKFCFKHFEYTKHEKQQRKKLYQLSFKQVLKLRFPKLIKRKNEK